MSRRLGGSPKPGEDYNVQLREKVEARIRKAREGLRVVQAELVGLAPVLACPHEWVETWTRRFDIHRSTDHQVWTCRICGHRAP